MTPFPFDPPPGLISDDTEFSAQGRWADANGFRFFEGKAEAIGGNVAMSIGAMGSIYGVRKMLAYQVSGATRVATAGVLLKTNVVDTSSTNITPAAGWVTTGRFCLQMWGDDLLASCSGGKLFTSSAGAQATEITQSPDVITCMIVTPSRQVMALGCNEEVSGTFNGRCIRFSDIEDNTDWTTSPTNNAGEYILPGQENIVSGCVLGDFVIIWTEGSMWLGEFVGDPAQPWSFTRVGSVGIAGLDAFAILHGAIYWVAPDLGFHTYQVGGETQGIPCPVSRDFSDNCAISSRGNIHAHTNTRYSEIWFHYPDSRDSVTEASRYLVYCVSESALAGFPVWTRGALFVAALMVGAVVDSPLLTAASSTKRTSLVVIGYDTSGGVPMQWMDIATSFFAGYILSADFYFEESQRRMMIRRVILNFEHNTGIVTLNIYTKDWPDSTPVDHQYAIFSSDLKKDLRVSGKIFSVKFTQPVVGRLRLGKPVFDIVPLGER